MTSITTPDCPMILSNFIDLFIYSGAYTSATHEPTTILATHIGNNAQTFLCWGTSIDLDSPDPKEPITSSQLIHTYNTNKHTQVHVQAQVQSTRQGMRNPTSITMLLPPGDAEISCVYAVCLQCPLLSIVSLLPNGVRDWERNVDVLFVCLFHCFFFLIYLL